MVYKVEKALYGLHQAPRAWYETLSTYLLENRFRRGIIDKTLFIKKDKGDLLLVQVYVDDIIFGSTEKSLCTEFEGLMHKKFQISSIGELIFFLRLQVMPRDDGIFISQDKYMANILKKFYFSLVKTASTLIETNKALLKDEEVEDVDVHLYRSMIGSLMYLTASRPDIMFVAYTYYCQLKVSAAKSKFTTAGEVNPTVYTSCIEQLWATSKVKNVNGESQMQALVDKKKVIIIEASIRRDLRFEDERGVNCLSNEVIFEQLTLMGSTMASAIICLATNKKFNFLKYIFDNMVKHLDGGVKFLMYPRFVQVFLDNEVEGMDRHNAIFVISSHTKKVFANMKREGKDFSEKVTPLFQSMMVQTPEDMGEGLEIPIDPHHTPIVTQSSSSPPKKKKKSKRKQRKEIEVPSPRVLDMEEAKTAQANKIASLQKKDKKLEQKRNLGDQKDASKHGRIIYNIDQDVEITLIDDTQRRMNKEDIFGVNDLDGDEVVVDVSSSEKVEQSVKVIKKEVSLVDPVTTAGKVVTTVGIEVTTAATTLKFSKDELTLAHTLIKIKAAKPKAIITAATTVTAVGTRRKAKGIVMQEPSGRPTPTPIDSSKKPSQAKDKGKGKMAEPKRPLKRKDQLMIDEEVAKNIKAQMQAELEEEDRLVRLKEEKANIALILFNNTMKWIEAFVPMNTDLVKGSKKAVEGSEKAEESSSKRAADNLEQEDAKRQMIEKENEPAELKRCLK
nr:putative ribonuclease H-like domain-containing protein [Tanacetum cinerariifolium]